MRDTEERIEEIKLEIRCELTRLLVYIPMNEIREWIKEYVFSPVLGVTKEKGEKNGL